MQLYSISGRASVGSSHRLSVTHDAKAGKSSSNPWAGTLNWGTSELDGMAGAASMLRLRPDSTSTPHTAAGRKSLTALGGWESVIPLHRSSYTGPPTPASPPGGEEEEDPFMRGRRAVPSPFDADRPATMSAMRLSRQADSPLPVLDNVVRWAVEG